MMKKMTKTILSAALTALLASPAFSQATPMRTQGPDYTGIRAVRGHYARAVQPNGMWQAYAPDTVVEGGHVLGRDPDPNVRLQLKRDPVADY
jgi:hypothetical protein